MKEIGILTQANQCSLHFRIAEGKKNLRHKGFQHKPTYKTGPLETDEERRT